MKHPRGSAGKSSRMFSTGQAHPRGFDSHHFNPGVMDERVEQADAVASTSHACHQTMWKRAFRGENLPACLAADDGLEVTNHHRVRVRP